MKNTGSSGRTGIPEGDEITSFLQQGYGLAFHSCEGVFFFGMAGEGIVQEARDRAKRLLCGRSTRLSNAKH